MQKHAQVICNRLYDLKMKKIFFITDYKGYFGSKYYAYPYRGGMDKALLTGFLRERGYEALFVSAVREELEKHDLSSGVIIFGSHQDHGLYYKGYLEDLAVALEASGYSVCPSPTLIRAHENKVFFEMLRHFRTDAPFRQVRSWWYGSYEEFREAAGEMPYPLIIKSPDGSMSRGVSLARNRREAEKTARKKMRTASIRPAIRDIARQLRHRNYVRESWKRKKIVVQEFIPGLKNDYKVLVYGNKYYVLFRKIREGDFRASGQGLLEYRRELPDGLLDFAEKCFNAFNAPQASFDIGNDGTEFYLFEAQYVCFGTYTIENSPYFFTKGSGGWDCIERKSGLEEEFAESLAWYLEK